jgi:hypothetical protein
MESEVRPIPQELARTFQARPVISPKITGRGAICPTNVQVLGQLMKELLDE